MSTTATPPTGSAPATELKREFTLWSSFAFAFAFISPIVALYGIFGLAITTAGPAFWWTFLVVFGGQLLVALVFAVLVSRWPLEGSIYQWSRGLLGTGYGWFAGWAYLLTLVIAMTTVALGAAGFVADITGLPSATSGQKALIALAILVAGTLLNLVGRVALKVFLTASIAAEVIGSLGLGTWLLLFHREQPLSALVHGISTDGGGPAYLALSGPFLVAMGYVAFSFVGFESAGSIAEEVREPRRDVPRAVILSLTLIAAVVMYSAAAIILAIPDLDAVLDGTDGDPVSSTLTTQLGAGVATPVEVLFVIGFLASFLALQTSASRVVWAYARDRALPGGRVLSRLSPGTAQPSVALLLVSGVGALLLLLSLVAGDVYTLMINFTTGGFYIAFLFPLLGFVVVQLRGRWRAGPFTLGRGTLPVSVTAAVWALFQLFNIAWPRPVNEQRWLDWSVWIAVGIFAVIGAALYASVRRHVAPAATPDEEAAAVAHEGAGR